MDCLALKMKALQFSETLELYPVTLSYPRRTESLATVNENLKLYFSYFFM